MNLHRRTFLGQSGLGLGSLALAWLGQREAAAAGSAAKTHHAARAEQVIFLNMAGGPSHIDLFDPKPRLTQLDGKPIDPEIIAGQRFAQLDGNITLLASPYKFSQHGGEGADFSELLPNLAGLADELCIVRSMTTDSVNHDPAQMMLHSGSILPGRPSLGSWLSYGLGSECEDLPAFVVMNSGRGQSVGAHLWGSGFLPTVHQGVQLRSGGVHFLEDPPWLGRQSRRRSLDALAELNELERERTGDPEIATRIAAYELAYRMQTSVPELLDFQEESDATLSAYGIGQGEAGYARNCLLARRLVEKGVRFIELVHRGWDHHGDAGTKGIDDGLPEICRQVDQPTAALLSDLKQRGLLEKTLVVWGGEFGRTPIRQFAEGKSVSLGRDHHRWAYTMLLAGGGIRRGITHGGTDELGFHVIENKVHVHDLQATLLHCLGIDHEKLTYRTQGRDFRLTDVSGLVVKEILA